MLCRGDKYDYKFETLLDHTICDTLNQIKKKMRKCFVYLFIFESGQMYKSLNNQAINVEKDPLPCCHNCIKSRP